MGVISIGCLGSPGEGWAAEAAVVGKKCGVPRPEQASRGRGMPMIGGRRRRVPTGISRFQLPGEHECEYQLSGRPHGMGHADGVAVCIEGRAPIVAAYYFFSVESPGARVRYVAAGFVPHPTPARPDRLSSQERSFHPLLVL